MVCVSTKPSLLNLVVSHFVHVALVIQNDDPRAFIRSSNNDL